MKLKKKTEKAMLSISDFRKPEIKVVENNSVAEVSEKEMPKEVLSTTNLDFENLWRKASDIDDKCHDYTVYCHKIQGDESPDFCVDFTKEGVRVACDSKDENHRITHHSVFISPFALGQLAAKLGVPMRYVNKCADAGFFELANRNFNDWLENYDKPLFVRQYEKTIRGILTPRYSCFDTLDILSVVDDCMNMDNFNIKGHLVSEERFHARFISKELLPVSGEDLYGGIFIDSSDVGRSVLTVTFGIFKQVCTNGLMIAKDKGVLFQQKHIGITPHEFKKGFIAALGNFDVMCKNSVKFINECRSAKISLATKEDTERFIRNLQSNVNMSKESAEKVIDLMNNRYGATRWGMINGITEVAQDFTLERRLELEKFAGEILIA